MTEEPSTSTLVGGELPGHSGSGASDGSASVPAIWVVAPSCSPFLNRPSSVPVTGVDGPGDRVPRR